MLDIDLIHALGDALRGDLPGTEAHLEMAPAYRHDASLLSVQGKPCRRSEEHTSELQSRGHLVCRLLLEKKKTKTSQPSSHITKRSTTATEDRPDITSI